jgi:hypothetical protein
MIRTRLPGAVVDVVLMLIQLFLPFAPAVSKTARSAQSGSVAVSNDSLRVFESVFLYGCSNALRAITRVDLTEGRSASANSVWGKHARP